MHIIAWNIWMGGGSRIGEIFRFLASRDADVLVLGEFQRGTTWAVLDLSFMYVQWCQAVTLLTVVEARQFVAS